MYSLHIMILFSTTIFHAYYFDKLQVAEMYKEVSFVFNIMFQSSMLNLCHNLNASLSHIQMELDWLLEGSIKAVCMLLLCKVVGH